MRIADSNMANRTHFFDIYIHLNVRLSLLGIRADILRLYVSTNILLVNIDMKTYKRVGEFISDHR